jgi:hypothetical protein
MANPLDELFSLILPKRTGGGYPAPTVRPSDLGCPACKHPTSMHDGIEFTCSGMPEKKIMVGTDGLLFEQNVDADCDCVVTREQIREHYRLAEILRAQSAARRWPGP